MFNAITSWDLSVLNFISENLRCPFLDTFFSLVTKFGDGGIFWIAVTIFLLIIPKQRKTGLMMAVAMILGFIIGNGILKNAVARIRPYDLVETEIILKRLSDFSFPSGHTLVCFEAATVLTLRKSIIQPTLLSAQSLEYCLVSAEYFSEVSCMILLQKKKAVGEGNETICVDWPALPEGLTTEKEL